MFHYLRSNVELSTLKYLSRRMKRCRAKQRYRADFFRFFWRDNVAPGVLLNIELQKKDKTDVSVSY